MKDIEKTINDWLDKHTVPYNTTILKNTVNTYNKRDLKFFDELTCCKFVTHRGKRKILTKGFYHKHTFDIPISEENRYGEPSLSDLVDKILEVEYNYGNQLDDAYTINIERIHEAIKFFKLDFDFEKSEGIKDNDYRVENGCFAYEGDDYEYDAEYFYRKSKLYKTLMGTLKEMLKYEFAPYRKYNPDYNPFSVGEPVEDFDECFKMLNREQIMNVLTVNRDVCGYGYSSTVDPQKTSSLVAISNAIPDDNVFKEFVLLLVNAKKEDTKTFVYAANRLYNL